jgi:hypothetical protein
METKGAWEEQRSLKPKHKHTHISPEYGIGDNVVAFVSKCPFVEGEGTPKRMRNQLNQV